MRSMLSRQLVQACRQSTRPVVSRPTLTARSQVLQMRQYATGLNKMTPASGYSAKPKNLWLGQSGVRMMSTKQQGSEAAVSDPREESAQVGVDS